MAPPAFLIRSAQFILLLGLLAAAANAATFPLQLPTRPTSFPLSRPTQIGDVVAWGSNNFAQITIPPAATNVVAIAAGPYHNLALRADGTVVAWGDNRWRQCDVPIGLNDVVAIGCGAAQSLAVKSTGQVVAWGTNDARIVVPAALANAVAVTGDYYSSFALKSDGTVVRWGISPRNAAHSMLTNVVAISGRWDSVSALIGTGHAIDSDSLVPLYNGISDVAGISSGLNGFALIRSDGNVYPSYKFNVPVGLRATAVAAASYDYAAIKGDSTVAVWGGDDTPIPSVLTNLPQRLRGVISIAGGERHFVALKLSTPPIPTIAKATAQIVNGFIVGLNIVDGGEGYAEVPKVTITDGGGSGATATAQISKGTVMGFTMINAGSGYTSQPNIVIDAPPLLPKLAIAPSRVNVTMQVVPGKRYQLESSDDLPNFSPVGAPFTAASNTVTNEFALSDTGQFFRIQEVP